MRKGSPVHVSLASEGFRSLQSFRCRVSTFFCSSKGVFLLTLGLVFIGVRFPQGNQSRIRAVSLQCQIGNEQPFQPIALSRDGGLIARDVRYIKGITLISNCILVMQISQPVSDFGRSWLFHFLIPCSISSHYNVCNAYVPSIISDKLVKIIAQSQSCLVQVNFHEFMVVSRLLFSHDIFSDLFTKLF